MNYEQIMRAIGEADADDAELYYVEIDSRLYGVHADTALHATIEVLTGIGGPDTWPDRCEVWNASYHREQYGRRHRVIPVPPPCQGAMTWRYEGEFRNGQPHGQGVMKRYKSEFRNGQPPPHRQGVMTNYNDGDRSFVAWPVRESLDDPRSYDHIARGETWRYEGAFHNGQPHGQGVMTFPNGRRTGVAWREIHLDGEFRNGKLNGQGVMRFPASIRRLEGNRELHISDNGGRYEGEFCNGKPHGQGVMTFAGEHVYRYKNTFISGNYRYEGEFRNGNLNGQGVMTDNNGYCYKGEFRNRLQHGRGVEEGGGHENPVRGSRYEGEFRNGKPHGWGVRTYPSGKSVEVKYIDKGVGGYPTIISR